MLLKVFVALLTIGASALPEAIPQAGTRTTTTTTTRTVTSTQSARTVTRTFTSFTCSQSVPTATRTATITTCTQRPTTTTSTITRTITRPATTVTRPASTITRTITRPASTITRPASTITRTVTFTPAPSTVKPPAFLEVIIHSDPLCGTKPVKQSYQNPLDDQITVPVLDSGSDCRDTKRIVGSFSFTRLNPASFARGCRLYYYSQEGCQNIIDDGTSLYNENKCINLPYQKMQSFKVNCN